MESLFSVALLISMVALSGSARLAFFHTVDSNPYPGMPRYFSTTFVEDTEVFACDSISQQCQPRAPWLKETQEFWNNTFILSMWTRHELGNITNILTTKFNETDEYPILQLMYGCEKKEDNTKEIFIQSAFDGQSLFSFDNNTSNWTTPLKGLEFSDEEWEFLNSSSTFLLGFLNGLCFNFLDQCIIQGKYIIDRKVAPAVKITETPFTSRMVTLTCKVYGFYPRKIKVYWMENGVKMEGAMGMNNVLPNEDGNYQIRVSVILTPVTGSSYSCWVEHASVPDGIHVPWDQPDDKSLRVGIIVAVVFIVILIISVAIILFICRRTPV